MLVDSNKFTSNLLYWVDITPGFQYLEVDVFELILALNKDKCGVESYGNLYVMKCSKEFKLT